MLACSLIVQAQEIDTHDNRMYITVGESSELSQVPISLHLENPTIEITALELYISMPQDANLSDGILAAARISDHELTEGNVNGKRFISIVSPKLTAIDGVDGVLCTWSGDFSALPDGEYAINVSGMFAVEENDGNITCYTSADQACSISKSNDSVTGIDGITTDRSSDKLEIYSIGGVRLSEPQPGQINIINGKKVKL